MNVKFVEFKKIFGEKHLGIASVILDDKILLRYKILPGKDGKGFYPKPGSYKTENGQYVEAFVLDSNFVKETIENVIREHVRQYLEEGIPF